jgi:hypothetical protein
VWRVVAESRALMRDPWFILLTLLAAGLCAWAFRLLRLASHPAPTAGE